MFVQIDELPSMYSRPLLSRSNAPRPSTKTSRSCRSAPFAHVGEWMPDKPLVSGNQFSRVPLRHERVVIWCGRRAAPTERWDAATLTPFLFWSAQSLAAHGVFSFLAKYDFETFFHRAILMAAALLLWPFLLISHVRGMADVGLAPNPRWGRDLCAGVVLSAIPLLCC